MRRLFAFVVIAVLSATNVTHAEQRTVLGVHLGASALDVLRQWDFRFQPAPVMLMTVKNQTYFHLRCPDGWKRQGGLFSGADLRRLKDDQEMLLHHFRECARGGKYVMTSATALHSRCRGKNHIVLVVFGVSTNANGFKAIIAAPFGIQDEAASFDAARMKVVSIQGRHDKVPNADAFVRAKYAGMFPQLKSTKLAGTTTWVWTRSSSIGKDVSENLKLAAKGDKIEAQYGLQNKNDNFDWYDGAILQKKLIQKWNCKNMKRIKS